MIDVVDTCALKFNLLLFSAQKMKALFYDSYDLNAIKLRDDLPKPSPTANEVLIRVFNAALNPVDVKMAKGYLSLVSSIKVPGFDVSGVVDAVGTSVSRFSVGNRVHAMAHFRKCGTCAEYVVVDQDYVAQMPENMPFPDAAAIPLVFETSLQALREVDLKSGESILVLGGSGGTGTAAIQLAKAMGATVTVTCSERNSELCKTLGAVETIDYTKDDFGTRHGQFDVVYDCVGTRDNFDKAKNVYKRGGRFVTIANDNEGPINLGRILKVGGSMLSRKVGSLFGGPNFTTVTCWTSGRNLEIIDKYFAEGKVRAIIDSTHKLENFKEAFERQASNRARGKVVICVATE